MAASMVKTTEPSEFPATVSELLQLLLSTFPPPIVWAYEGAYAHLVAEAVHLYPWLAEHVEQRDSAAFFRDVARLSAVLLADIENTDPSDPSAEALSALSAIAKLMMSAGLRPGHGLPDPCSFSDTFCRYAKGWNLGGLVALFQSRWHWPS